MDSGLSSEIYGICKIFKHREIYPNSEKIGGSVGDSHARKLEKINIS